MYERMLNKTTEPSVETMTAYCGDTSPLFAALNDWLSVTFGTRQEITFPYGSRYGWNVTHRRKGKLMCHVFAEENAFTVMLRLSDAQFASVYDGLGAYARAYIDSRYPCGDGGWIQYRVAREEHLADVKTLLAVKCG